MAQGGYPKRNRSHRAPALPYRRWLGFEPLEDRRVLAALFVNSPLDNTIAGDGLVTLREAILAANNDSTTDLGHKGSFADEIAFDFGHDGPETIVLTAGHLVVNSDLKITSSSPDLLTIDAAGSDMFPDADNGNGSRVFDILLRSGFGWNVTLQGMTLTGGDASGRGGAIQAAGNLTLNSVRIIDNASVNNGGAIYATHRLELNNAIIVDNASGGYGGGVHAVGGINVTLSNSIITGNTARYTGGGLFIDDTVLTIIGGTVSDNHAAAVGFRGGGLYARDTHVLATDTVIAGNDAAEGGGVFALRSRLTFNTSQISGNKALAGSGGGIHIDVTTGGLTLNSSRMIGNTSSVHGGAVYSRNSLVAVNDSFIAENQATHNGGGIIVRNEQLRVIRSRITGNTAGTNGGGLAADTVTAPPQAGLYIADSMIDNNTAGGSGGGVYAYRPFSSTITRSTLHTNTANSGGAIRVQETSIGVVQSTISGNHAVTSGGAVSALDSSVSLAHSTLTVNSAASNPDGTGVGGGIVAYGDTNIALGHSIVAGNIDPSMLGPEVFLASGPGSGNPGLTASYSLIGDNRGTFRAEAPVGLPDATGNLIGDVNGQGIIDPSLSLLAYHGGQEFLDGSLLLTRSLLAGSPAIDAGNPSAAPGTGSVALYDQRGAPFTRVFGGRIDMGAFEAQSLTLVIDTLVDEDDGEFAAGDFSLREAIRLANVNPGADAVEFAPSLSATGPATIVLTHGELAITDSMTINGLGANVLTIDASGNDPTPDENNGDGSPVFVVSDGAASSIEVNIGRLTITGGDSPGDGGAIRSLEPLLLSDVFLKENSALLEGGAIDQTHGNLTIVRSVISHNSSRRSGGGVSLTNGSLTLSGSVVSFNATMDDFGYGGGISVDHSFSDDRADYFVVIEESIVSHNSTIGTLASGAGVAVLQSFGETVSVTISGSTISENGAARGVAGIYLYHAIATIADSTVSSNHLIPRSGTTPSQTRGGIYIAFGELSVIRSTVTNNSGYASPGSFGSGHGIYSSGSQVHVDHSIVAGNTNIIGSHPNPVDIDGSGVVTARFSVVGAATGILDEGGNVIGTSDELIDPRLGPLAYNGGATFTDGSVMLTHALLPGSPALDAGDPAARAGVGNVPLYDQRGAPFARVVDGDGTLGARIDIGALEQQPNPLPGDYNFSGVVDAADFVVWRKNVGSTANLQADGDSDGDVDQGDYNVWRANFGRVHVDEPAATASAMTVDESEQPQGDDRIVATEKAHQAEFRETGRGTREVASVRQVRHGPSSISIGTSTLPDDLALLAWLRAASGTAADETEDHLQKPSGDERQELKYGSRPAIDLVFAGLGQLKPQSPS